MKGASWAPFLFLQAKYPGVMRTMRLALVIAMCVLSIYSSAETRLTEEDKKVIEAAVPAHKAPKKGYIVFDSATVDRSAFDSLLTPEVQKLDFVKNLQARNEKTTFLDGFKPTWAKYVNQPEQARPLTRWSDYKASVLGANYDVYVSLPGYSKDGKTAVLFMSRSQAWDRQAGQWEMEAVMSIIKLVKSKEGWKPAGTVGQIEKF